MPFKITYSVLQLLFSQYVKELYASNYQCENDIEDVYGFEPSLPPIRLHLYLLRTICQFANWLLKLWRISESNR